MSNVRILYENKADETSALTASTTSGTLVAANMLTDIRSKIHRSTGTSVQYDLRWSSAVTLSMVALVFGNYTDDATLRCRGYTEVADPVAAVDTTALNAGAYESVTPWNWGALAPGVNQHFATTRDQPYPSTASTSSAVVESTAVSPSTKPHSVMLPGKLRSARAPMW